MANMFVRLVLSNNTVIQALDPWKDAHGKVQPAKVGMIFFRPESSETWVEKFDDGSEPVDHVDVTAAHYEVWAVPDKGGAWDKAGETMCKRISDKAVLWAEEVWSTDEAALVIQERLSESDDDEDEEDEESADATEGVDSQDGSAAQSVSDGPAVPEGTPGGT